MWRIESARLIGALVRMVGDVGLAEDLAQEALVTALERWPAAGIPDNPGAWLVTTAQHRAIDQLRRAKMLDRKHDALGAEAARSAARPDVVAAIDDGVADDVLRLVLIACHPVLSKEARAALTLQLVARRRAEHRGDRTGVPGIGEPTIAQRIVRAKRTLAEARVPFEVPRGPELAARLTSVLEVVYLIFNEGYAASAGEHWTRPELCDEALRLGRVLAELAPGVAEVHGLVALVELQASRLRARVGADGAPILLMDQDRARWDQLLVHRGLAALARAETLGRPLGPYALQAAIAGCHARALRGDDTDWPQIVALYDALVELTRSPVVELNRAVAVAMAFGPAAGLELVDALVDEPALAAYHLLPAVRADLLAKLGRRDEARAELLRAAEMTENARERELMLVRAAQLSDPSPTSS